MKISAFGYMPVTYLGKTDKTLTVEDEVYIVCVYLSNTKEQYKRYTLASVVRDMVVGQDYLVSFNIEAFTHRFFFVSIYPPKSLVSVERRMEDD